MSDRDVAAIRHTIEHSPKMGHHHDFENAYQQIAQMQNHEGGLGGAEFRHDMANLNRQLHDEGKIPNLEIIGVDERHHTLLTRDIAGHVNREQQAENVNDFGALGSGPNPREAELALRARMLGLGEITRNPDGSYEVPMPQIDQRALAQDFMATILGGFMPGSDPRGGRTPLGMNPWEAQAWRGWPQEPPE